MKMVPISYRVIIKVEKSDLEKRAEKSGLVLTEDSLCKEKSAQQEAIIVALGPAAFRGVDYEGTEILPGDRVLVTRYSGESREDIEEGYLYRVINDEDVLCKLEE